MTTVAQVLTVFALIGTSAAAPPDGNAAQIGGGTWQQRIVYNRDFVGLQLIGAKPVQ
jgi:hypothetical protein